jgi:hypothetical protein
MLPLVHRGGGVRLAPQTADPNRKSLNGLAVVTSITGKILVSLHHSLIGRREK